MLKYVPKKWIMVAAYSEGDALNQVRLIRALGLEEDSNVPRRFMGDSWVVVYGGSSIPSVRCEAVFITNRLQMMLTPELNSNDEERKRLKIWIDEYVSHRLLPGVKFSYL